MIPSDKIVVSDLLFYDEFYELFYELFYDELIKIVHKHTHLPLNLVCLMAGHKKIDQTSVIDLRENQLINVYVKGFGETGEQGVSSNEKVCVLCESKTTFKYLHIKTINQEKINVIQTMTKKILVKNEDHICYKCEWKATRKLEKTDHQPTKKRGSVMNFAF